MNKNKFEDKSYRLLILEHFNQIINKIDIDTETVILKLNKQTNNKTSQHQISEVNTQRANLLDIINKAQERSLTKLNEKIAEFNANLLPVNNYEEILSEFFYYLEMDCLKDYRRNNYQIGILVETDFYLRDHDWSIFKYEFC